MWARAASPRLVAAAPCTRAICTCCGTPSEAVYKYMLLDAHVITHAFSISLSAQLIAVLAWC